MKSDPLKTNELRINAIVLLYVMIFANAASQKGGGRGGEGGKGQCEYLIIYVGPKTQLSRVLWGWRFEPLFTYSSMFIND